MQTFLGEESPSIAVIFSLELLEMKAYDAATYSEKLFI
jgi:hypothetical protein